MHKKLLIFTCFLFGFLPIKAVDNNHLIDRPDSILKLQSLHIEGKEREIKILKVKLDNEHNELRRLQLCNQLYKAYHVFQFDSAMIYVEKGCNSPTCYRIRLIMRITLFISLSS